MNENDLMTDDNGSLPASDGNVDGGATLFEKIFDMDLTPEASEEVTEIEVEEHQSDESSEQDEVLEDTADEDADLEADEDDEVEEDDQEEFSGDIDVMSITELAEQVGKIEINGKEYSPAQLKSILGQEESAGTKAREASAKLKEIEEREAKLAEQEEWLTQRSNASGKSDQLVEMQSEARKITAAIEQARTEGDMYELTVQKDKLDSLKQDYAVAQQEVQAVQRRQEAEMFQKAEAGLKELGLGYLLEDNAESKAWTKYASDVLSPQEIRAVTMNPQLAALVEKARKYDSSVKGETVKRKKVQSSTKTLKAGTGTKVSSKTQKAEANRKARLRSGQGTDNDVDAAALNAAKFFLS